MTYLLIGLFVFTLILAITATIAGKLYCAEREKKLELETEIVKARAEAEQAKVLLDIRNEIDKGKKEDEKNLKNGSIRERFNAASGRLCND